jgi:subtilisin family serine protease
MSRRLVLLAMLSLALVVDATDTPVAAKGPLRRYLVLSRSDSAVPASVLQQVQRAGATVRRNLSPMGILAVSSDDPAFAAKVPDALAVTPDLRVNAPRPGLHLGPALTGAARVPGPPNTDDDDVLLNLQWGITAVDAQNAWNLGRRGGGAIVAVLDEGVDATHPDLADNVRADLSTSFAEDCTGQIEPWQPEPGFYFNHGTHVAGIAAAADNAFGVVGVAPRAQIMAVGVLSRCLGYGLDSWILDGIRHAADHGADVINMSLGAVLDVQGGCDGAGSCYTAEDVRNITLAYAYAARYARQRGATVIASSGNEGIDFDVERTLVHLPSDAPGILSVSAVGPVGWAIDPDTSLYARAAYSNFGLRRIDVAAPGGTDDLALTDPNSVCTVAEIEAPCFVFDWVFSTIPGGWAWASGTSMAAPHASGVAAQYIGAAGGHLPPVAVETLLEAFADRQTRRRVDPFYGRGVVDATVLDAH